MKLTRTLSGLFFCTVLAVSLFTISSHAQSNQDYGQDSSQNSYGGDISAPIPARNPGAPGFLKLKAIFDSFRNQSFRSSGIVYGAEIGFESLGEYEVYVGAPMLYGQIQNKNVSEFGNPYLGGRVMLFDDGGMQNWLKLEHRFSQPQAEIAARHSTLKPGLELIYDKIRTVGSLGGDYHWRYGEADPHVDVKDIVSAHISVGRKLTRRFTLEAELLWYRAFGVKTDTVVIARDCDWTGAGPVGTFHLGSGVLVKSSLLFPISQSRSQSETEVAVWDADLPKVSEVTWRTDVGVQF